MDKVESKKILSRQINELRKLSYSELCRLVGEIETLEVMGESESKYQFEIQVIWDNKPGGNLRVIVSIDDSSIWRAISPLSEDFIIAPDGSFIGE